MANPTATARQTPAGFLLPEGFASKLTFSNKPDLCIFEKSVQPPGWDGGEPIEQTTQHNQRVRTFAPRTLLMLTPVTVKVAYDPQAMTDIRGIININQTITVRYYDGSTIAFFGFATKFEPDALEEGKQPEATLTVHPSNWDPVNRVEALPTVTTVLGT